MKPARPTPAATASEPTEFDARTHAIKNCVNVIYGLAWSIERQVDPIACPRVTKLMEACRRLVDLIVLHTNAGDARRANVPIERVVQLVVERLGPQAESRAVRLSIACAGGTVIGDSAELAEAVYNLASNALHASPPGSTVQITTRRSAEGDHEWLVKDAGCGIPANVLPRLGTVGLTTRDEGTGLGLSLAFQAITRHEGAMHIESTEGRGTTVLIWLPGTSGEPAVDRKVESSGCAVRPALGASVSRVLDDV
jgi:signal transduction histidine kinase